MTTQSDNQASLDTAAFLTVEEVAALLRVHPSAVYEMIRRAQVPARKVGKEWRVSRTAIDDWFVVGSEQGALIERIAARTAELVTERVLARLGQSILDGSGGIR